MAHFFLSKSFHAVVFTVAIALISAPLSAQSGQEPAWLKAGRWARANEGIAIAITLGSDAGLNPIELQRNFERGFLDAFEIVTVAFIEENESLGSVISYFYGPYGTKAEPFQTGATMARMEQVVGAYHIYLAAEGLD